MVSDNFLELYATLPDKEASYNPHWPHYFEHEARQGHSTTWGLPAHTQQLLGVLKRLAQLQLAEAQGGTDVAELRADLKAARDALKGANMQIGRLKAQIERDNEPDKAA